MTQRPLETQHQQSDQFEAVMRKVSLIISLVALALMIGGLFVTLASGTSLTSATETLSVSAFRHTTQVSPGLVAMSAGIVLLALLPGVRVGLALWLYGRQRQGVDALVALIVLLELLLSMWLGE
jgi:uncharacterized membrane protein